MFISPLTRAKQTLAPLRVRKNPPVVTLDELREIDLGSWEGRDKAELKEEDPTNYAAWKEAPLEFFIDGERPLVNLWARAEVAWEKMRSGEAEVSADATTLIVAHNGIGQALLCTSLGLDVTNFRRYEMPNCGAYELYTDGYDTDGFIPRKSSGKPDDATRWRWLIGGKSKKLT